MLSVDGFEALRLADAERFDHETAAALMGVSRPTFSRILTEARATVATALTHGWALRIAGGDYRLADDRPDRPEGHRPGQGPGRGRGHGRGRRHGRRSGRDIGVPETEGDEDALS